MRTAASAGRVAGWITVGTPFIRFCAAKPILEPRPSKRGGCVSLNLAFWRSFWLSVTTIDSGLQLLTDALVSPQGPTLASDGHSIYVADYVGVQRIDEKTGVPLVVAHPWHIPLNGIDCLMRSGKKLIAIQNGTTPPRVLLLQLSHSGRQISKATIIESNSEQLGTPTHGVIRGRRFYYLANTGFEKFDQSGALIPGKKVSASKVLFFDL